jgi:hypothetical protein
MNRRLVPSLRSSLFGFASIVACSSSPASPGSAPGDGDASATSDVGAPDRDNCVAPGSAGNTLGIGAYCDAQTTCPAATPGHVLLCTANFGAPAHEWFCTSPCTGDSECGDGAVCVTDTRGRGCVPVPCTAKDAGADALAE